MIQSMVRYVHRLQVSWDVYISCVYHPSSAQSSSRAQPPPHQKGMERHHPSPFTDGEGLWLSDRGHRISQDSLWQSQTYTLMGSCNNFIADLIACPDLDLAPLIAWPWL